MLDLGQANGAFKSSTSVLWVAFFILIWAVTLQKICWAKFSKSTIFLPGPNKCSNFQIGAKTKLEEISNMLRCLFVALYIQFLVNPTTLVPQIPNSFPAISMAAKYVKNTAFSQYK